MKKAIDILSVCWLNYMWIIMWIKATFSIPESVFACMCVIYLVGALAITTYYVVNFVRKLILRKQNKLGK